MCNTEQQKEKIAEWMFQAIREYYMKKCTFPNDKHLEEVVDTVYEITASMLSGLEKLMINLVVFFTQVLRCCIIRNLPESQWQSVVIRKQDMELC